MKIWFEIWQTIWRTIWSKIQTNLVECLKQDLVEHSSKFGRIFVWDIWPKILSKIFWPAQACWADTQVEGQHAGPHQLCHPLRLSPPPLEDGRFAHLPGPPGRRGICSSSRPTPLEDGRLAHIPAPLPLGRQAICLSSRPLLEDGRFAHLPASPGNHFITDHRFDVVCKSPVLLV